ncbi:hypothetical protein PT974_12405 [Cladobotryum mycophilum]|uniref:Uncharacterized protein n=1 Tax=Cladobotryum mycophilum TaxID=491253 RepID=A0ABR0S7W5_9HYPO
MSNSVIIRPGYDVCKLSFPHQVTCKNERYIKCGDGHCPFRSSPSTEAKGICGTWLGKANQCCYVQESTQQIFPTCDEVPGLVAAKSIDSIGTDPTSGPCGGGSLFVSKDTCCTTTSSAIKLFKGAETEDVDKLKCYDRRNAGDSSGGGKSSPSKSASGDKSTPTSSSKGSSSTSGTPNNGVNKQVGYVLGSFLTIMAVAAQL